MIKTKERKANYLDFIRILACMMIIGVHVCGWQWDAEAVASVNWQIMNLYDCLFLTGVSLYVMISGALMLRSDRELPMKTLFRKTLRLFIIYHIWLFLYNLLNFIGEGLSFTFYNVKEFLILKTIRGEGIYHLWFLPMLIVLYLLTPILKEAFRKKKICAYFLVLYGVITLLFPTLFLFEFPFKYLLMDFYNRTEFVMLTGYIGYYVAGHYIHEFVGRLSKKWVVVTAFYTIASYGLIVGVCAGDALQKAAPSTILNSPLTLNHFGMAMGLFLLMRQIFTEPKSEKLSRILVQVSGLTFGVYLMHPLILEVFTVWGMSTCMFFPLFSIPFFVITIFLICLGISFILKRIPLIRKSL